MIAQRLVASLLVTVLAQSVGAAWRVDSQFEGASVQVIELDEQARRVRFAPGGDPKQGWPCWWMFELQGVTPGEVLHLELDGASMRRSSGGVLAATWAMPHRASYSEDSGATWLRTEPAVQDGKVRRWALTPKTPQVRVAWGPAFVPSDAQALVDRMAMSPHATAFVLAQTRGNRPVPALRVREGEEADRPAIWIQARRHAWEAGSSWVGRGFIEWLMGEDPRAIQLRRSVEVLYVPIMDVDGVATGNGGKERVPQDHNRDWSDMPHWPAVDAAQKQMLALNQAGRLVMFMDLHNPGPNDQQPFYYTVPPEDLSETGRRHLKRWVECTQTEMTGPLVFTPQTRASGKAYDPKNWQRISKNWVHAHTHERVVAVTLETSWNAPGSDVAGYLAVGRQLGLAMELYMRPVGE